MKAGTGLERPNSKKGKNARDVGPGRGATSSPLNSRANMPYKGATAYDDPFSHEVHQAY